MKSYLITFEVEWIENFVRNSFKKTLTIENFSLKSRLDVNKLFQLLRDELKLTAEQKIIILFVYELETSEGEETIYG